MNVAYVAKLSDSLGMVLDLGKVVRRVGFVQPGSQQHSNQEAAHPWEQNLGAVDPVIQKVIHCCTCKPKFWSASFTEFQTTWNTHLGKLLQSSSKTNMDLNEGYIKFAQKSLTLHEPAMPATTVMLEETTSVMESPTKGHAYWVARLPMDNTKPPTNANATDGPLSCILHHDSPHQGLCKDHSIC